MNIDFSLATFRDSEGNAVEKPDAAAVGWRISAYAALTSADYPGCILMVRAHDAADHWQLPGGGVEVWEGLLRGLHREVHEETGYGNAVIVTNPVAVTERAFYQSALEQFSHAVLLIFRGEIPAGTPMRALTNDSIGMEVLEVRWIPLEDTQPEGIHEIHREYVGSMKVSEGRI
ncbi:MAG: hypothetical protein RL141_7 [Candidatus Parcubacteria bacterium]|jgi:8-oxo-dGTP pyrophosphatase MutT (NUDIX family)